MIFNYDPAHSRKELQQNGYVHLKDIFSSDFIAYTKKFYEESLATAETESHDWKVTGKKRQFVFDFPSDEAANEFRNGMANLLSYDTEQFTVSERHLKVYDNNAEPYPAPHKDRSASEYSIGIPVKLTPGSSVCIFPNLDPGVNPDDRARFISEDEWPNINELYEQEQPVLLNENVGDLVVFLGSALYHERVNASGAAVLYLKANGRHEDPLGENIFA